MSIEIKTLTPLWTGDVERKCKSLRETSILGSLRWWFEAIVRGLGGYACDPTSNSKCPREDEKTKNLPVERKICPICYIFGTTGWSKRFRFEINQSFLEMYDENLVIAGSKRNWYYPSGLVSSDDEKSIVRYLNPVWKVHTPFDQNNGKIETEYDLESILKVLLIFISNWGTIGGKTAIGYGVVEFEFENSKLNNSEIKEFFEYLKDKSNDGVNAENAPKLNEMFFAKFRIREDHLGKIIEKVGKSVNVKNGKKEYPKRMYKCNRTEERLNSVEEFLKKLKDYYGFIPTSALIRRELRSELHKDITDGLSEDELQKLRHFLMGKLGDFSKINISHIYWNGVCWEFRIWGWIPEDIGKYVKINSNISRENVVVFLKKLFNSQDFWKNVFGVDCIEKPDGANYVVEYPRDNWNFIDLGKVEDIERAFEDMIWGVRND